MMASRPDAALSREELLAQVVSAERKARELMEEAARLSGDPDERELYRRLAARETESLRQLEEEEERLLAEEFVQKALDV